MAIEIVDLPSYNMVIFHSYVSLDSLEMMISKIYPLVMTNIAMENGPFIDGLPINSMVIFHSYASLPEGITCFFGSMLILASKPSKPSETRLRKPCCRRKRLGCMALKSGLDMLQVFLCAMIPSGKLT